MLKISLLLLFCFWGSINKAVDKNEFYRVRDVASNDVLNIRADHSTKAEIIATIPSDGQQLRQTGPAWPAEESFRHRWCPVEYEKIKGWVYCRYLTEDPDRQVVKFDCAGSDPFWSLKVRANRSFFVSPSESIPNIRITAVNTSGKNSLFRGMTPARQAISFTINSEDQCGDGMASNLFTHKIDLKYGNASFTGCCAD